jgi:hypothetical protein
MPAEDWPAYGCVGGTIAEVRPAYGCVGGINIDDIVFPNGETRMAVLGGGTVSGDRVIVYDNLNARPEVRLQDVVSAVLMSEHAYDDPTLKTRLQSKGDLVLTEQDAAAMLETKTLRAQVRVLDMQYGFSDTLPPRSFFEHIVVEIAAWQKA